MIFGGLYEEEGTPFTGRKLEKLKTFLADEGLSYDDTAEYTLLLTDEEGPIAAAGSVAENVLKCIAVSKEYQGEGLAARIVTGLCNYCLTKGRSHLFLFTKPKNLRMFTDLGFEPVLCTEDVLFMENSKGGLKTYVEGLTAESAAFVSAFRKKNGREPVCGAIVANCNPFTLGHAYLVEEALKGCDLLHLFILSEDRSEFTAAERADMVRLSLEWMGKTGIADTERVLMHATSDYLISRATFPTYFIKDKAKAEDANCELDVRIFAECIAGPLGITKRFAGTEPSDPVTAAYNQKMKEILPQYGIEFVEIPRMEAIAGDAGSTPISAKSVRRFLSKGMWDEISRLVPESTLTYLKNQKGGTAGTSVL